MKLDIFDPPICCSRGVCGPAVGLALVPCSAESKGLEQRGVSVARCNLVQEPTGPENLAKLCMIA